MAGTSYDYSTRSGLRPISWNDFHGLVKALAQAVYPWRPEWILPVGRGGYYPGALLSHVLQVDAYPVRLSRRVDDVVVRDVPEWLVEPPAAVAGLRVLVVDEMCSTGETVRLVKARADMLGAAETRAAVLYAHTWGVDHAEYIGLITDDLVMNPWDREIYRDGAFQFHPEYVEGLAHQDAAADSQLRIPATSFVAAKTTPPGPRSGRSP